MFAGSQQNSGNKLKCLVSKIHNNKGFIAEEM